MPAQTSRYGIQYPTGSDLVSNIPQHMQSAANSIEQALADVDDRHTTNAYATVVRSTYAQLKSVKATTGQLGFVTGDTALYHGAYMFDGSSWIMQGTRDITSTCTNIINTTYWSVPRLAVMLISNNLISLNITVRRTNSEWWGDPAQDIFNLPSVIVPTNIAWSPFDPRFGVAGLFENNGKFRVAWNNSAAENRHWPANNNLDFTLTQQVQVNI